jgi:hypothetical protein
MAFDLEAIVGHLYIVSGRSINAMPPGMLVEAAPRKAARGREMDTLFVVVLPSSQFAAPASFYTGMAQLAAETYFNSTGSVTSGVRTLFNTLNHNLYQHNETSAQAFEANIVCAILHGTDLFLARVGGGVAMIQGNMRVEYFPASFENDDALYGPPLGVQPVPDIKMTQLRLTSGARLVLADSSLAELDAERSLAALGAAHMGDVIMGYKMLVATGNLSLLAVEFVPPDSPDQVVARPTQSTRPDAIPETPPPVVTAPAAGPGAIKATRHRVQRGASAVAIKVADSLDSMNTIVDKIGEKSTKQPGRLAQMLSSSSIVLLPIALIVLVIIMWLAGTGESEFELCVREASDAATFARGIATNDVIGTLAAWNAVLLTIDRCNEIRPGDIQLATIMREGREIIDTLNEIKRRDAVVIESFPNATLRGLILRGEDLYVLDDANDQVYRITLADSGLSMVPNTRQPIATMRRGAGVGQYTLENILDITWSEDGSGLSQGNVLLALDRQGVLVEYSPTFLARGVQRLLGTEQWVNPIKLTSWRGRLYILDPGADQIWRYDPSGGTFPSSPLEYFIGTRRPSLANAVDFGIDDTGRVYVLFEDGVIAMFRSGEELRFGFADFPPNQSLEIANAMHLNTNPVSPGIYLINRPDRTVFETTQAGTFIASYRTFDESQFDLLTDIVADENKRIIYVTSGNTILAFPK